MSGISEDAMSKLLLIVETGRKLGALVDSTVLKSDGLGGHGKVFSCLTLQQAHICMTLCIRGSCGLKELAESAGVTPSSMSVMVDKLVDKGMLSREIDGEDRRKVRIGLMPRALSAMETIHRDVVGLFIRIGGLIGEEAVGKWLEVMGEVNKAMRQLETEDVGE